MPFQVDGLDPAYVRERVCRVAERTVTLAQVAVDTLAADDVRRVVAASVGGPAEHAEVGLKGTSAPTAKSC